MKIKVKIDEQMFEVEINDLAARPIVALVDGQCFEVWPEEETAPAPAPEGKAPVERLAPAPRPIVAAVQAVSPAPAGSVDKAKTILAPIPGVILTVAVCAGATVKVGQELCVLEAMKMKNAIRSTRAGTIANIYISEGDHVKHGQVLIDFAD
jgi:glutaconyl-CoA/methylmalonyl-CoA decarboxylase subunit gamma